MFQVGFFTMVLQAAVADESKPRFDFGRAATPAEIAGVDIAIGPHGDELPRGSSTAREGALIYARKCAACHGADGRQGPDPALVGGLGTLDSVAPVLTVGSFWPYATTVFDYIYRAMPLTQPGSLEADEVYALTAFLLHRNGIITEHDVLDRDRLPKVRMPNRDGFVRDPRPDVP
jgi:S-disulfanyl-L-cysteine oxidoreductase SoxD